MPATTWPAGPPPSVVWFTGLSGAGKSTIAYEVYDRLLGTGVKAEYLDGDIIRGILPATGYSRRERDEHVRRVGFVASRLEHHGVFVVCALISPYTESRACVRQLCRRFLEIHVATPLDECERRDVKGLSERARRGEIAGFTGIDDAYEEPVNPELRIDTRGVTVERAADLVMSVIESPRALETIRRFDEGLSLQEF
jgi:adenylylsulfate kinase